MFHRLRQKIDKFRNKKTLCERGQDDLDGENYLTNVQHLLIINYLYMYRKRIKHIHKNRI